jgi:hypothetical protein
VSDGGVHILCEFEALIVDAVIIIISCNKNYFILFIYLFIYDFNIIKLVFLLYWVYHKRHAL